MAKTRDGGLWKVKKEEALRLKRSLAATQDIFIKAFCQARDHSGKIKSGRPADPVKVSCRH